jgi:hypothetical protein
MADDHGDERTKSFLDLYGALLRRRVRERLPAATRKFVDGDDFATRFNRRMRCPLADRLDASRSERELWSLALAVARNTAIELAQESMTGADPRVRIKRFFRAWCVPMTETLLLMLENDLIVQIFALRIDGHNDIGIAHWTGQPLETIQRHWKLVQDALKPGQK